MKKCLKSTLSILLVALMLLSAIPFSVSATETGKLTFTVSNKNAVPGETVDVEIVMTNNPGIASIGLNVGYDSDILAIENITFNSAMGGTTQTSQLTKNPAKIIWISSTSNFNGDATVATITFRANADITNNVSTNVELTYDPDDIYNIAEDNIDSEVVNGVVNVVAAVPGDINGDTKVNNKDVTRLLQYLAQWDVKVNNKDVTRLMQYLAHWDVEIHVGSQSSVACSHNLTKVDAVAAACEEDGNITYWHCEKCGKYYADANAVREIKLEDTIIEANGHSPEVIPAIPATYDSEGYTEGSRCSVCGKILVEPQQIPIPPKDEYPITYHIYADDTYLQGIGVRNPNPDTYITQDGLRLQNLTVEGYIFEGWYDGEGANGELVKTIPAGTTGAVELYAKWTERQYSINFDSPDVPVSSIQYTVSKGATLTNAKCYGYTFVGWSDDNGFLRSKIKPGTTGNLTLHANWTSNRNRATGFSSYAEPSIIENDNDGQFLFVYDIGRIDNVPLSQIEFIGNSDGIRIDSEYQVVNTIEKTNAEKMANIVSNTTTRSSGWTLSDEWEKTYEAGNEVDETKGKSSVRTDIEGNTVGGNYFVSNSKGGSSYLSTDSGSSYSNSAKVTTENSKGINGSYDSSTEKYCDVQLGAKNETELSAGASFPVKIVDVSVGVKNTTTLSAGIQNGRRDKEAVHVDTNSSSYVGTVNQSNQSGYYNVSSSNSSNWNSTESYEKSYQQSRSTEVSNAISEQITKKTSYSVTDSLKGAHSSHEEVGGTEGREDEYSTSLQYSEGDATTKTQRITFNSSEPGYYRLVNAGTLHVFGVVGYDVATNSYYTYTYSVLDDERHTYLDFSLDNALFEDCQNSLVPFEIPHEVNEYVAALTYKSDDIEFGLDGKVNGYEGTDDNATVILPQYYSAKNGADGSNTAVKITAFDSSTFKNNKKIKRVVLPVYISEIPDGAFEGCTNLEEVVAMGVTKIGNNAFKGCTSLNTFAIDNMVTSLGNNAFEGVNEIKVMASKVSVFNAALASGAKRITVNVSKMAGSIDNRTLTVDDSKEYFALLSNGTTYSNLQIKSAANETYISNMILTDNSDTPLDITSQKLTLNRLSVDGAPGFAMILRKDNTEMSLYDVINLVSSSDNAILSKSITLKKENNEVSSILNTTGDVLVCGSVENEALLRVQDNNNNRYETITEEDYNRYVTSGIVTFDSNGGNSLGINTKTVYYGQTYGDMPIPERENYSFEGWFTEKNGGNQIKSDTAVTVLANQTLYAHWTELVCSVTFNPNGGNVETEEKELVFGHTYGELPIPQRDYYIFDGWFTETDGGTQVTSESVCDTSVDFTLYAHWTSKPEKGPVTSVPSGAKQTRTATQYRYRDGNWGGWSSWQNSWVGASDTRQVQTRNATYLVFWYNYSNDSCVDSQARANSLGGYTKIGDWVSSSSVYYYNPYGTGDHYWSSELGAEGYPRAIDGTATQYSYRDLYWGNWSSWQNSYVGGSSTRQVETRAVYYYIEKQCAIKIL